MRKLFLLPKEKKKEYVLIYRKFGGVCYRPSHEKTLRACPRDESKEFFLKKYVSDNLKGIIETIANKYYSRGD